MKEFLFVLALYTIILISGGIGLGVSLIIMYLCYLLLYDEVDPWVRLEHGEEMLQKLHDIQKT